MSEPPKIGSDEWVARSHERVEGGAGARGALIRIGARVGWWWRLAGCVVVAALIPHVTSSGYVVTVGINTLLLALLALGLNVVVGWAGLLDLGYVAFYGFGAYLYALICSDQLGGGVHVASEFAIPLVMIAAGILGFVIGSTSRRVSGDYLAIVTLFFGEIFTEVVGVDVPGVTGGPNGVTGVDPIHAFGAQITSINGYYYFALVVTVIVMAALHLLDSSRTGRAWRAVREEPLAAELMSISVNRLKILAFVVGAVIAALAGTIFAAFETGTYPTDFDTSFLVLVYAAVILGGAGSIAGVVVGAVVVSVMLEILRNPTEAGYIFYGLILVTLVGRLRPWRTLAAVLAALVVFGVAVHAIAAAISSAAVAGGPQSQGWIGVALRYWVVVPVNATNLGNWGYGLLLLAVVGLTRVGRTVRLVLLVPTIYLASFVWETVLVTNPTTTREILVGVILIVLMIARPNGALGVRRVEVAT
jgi:branched-chain amino acid transport system permease protein